MPYVGAGCDVRAEPQCTGWCSVEKMVSVGWGLSEDVGRHSGSGILPLQSHGLQRQDAAATMFSTEQPDGLSTTATINSRASDFSFR